MMLAPPVIERPESATWRVNGASIPDRVHVRTILELLKPALSIAPAAGGSVFPSLDSKGDMPMKTRYVASFAILAGFGLGAIATQSLYAQAKKAPLYTVAEIEVKNQDAYVKEYAAPVQALIKKSGGRIIAAGGMVTSIEGPAQKARVAIQVWDSMEQYQAYRKSADFGKLRKIGDKYATFRTYTVEGLPQ
jgi:uncharacterized protein (DUF1330 family)